MFTYKRIVRMGDTDATGAVYFARQLQIGVEAFEEYLAVEQATFSLLLKEKKIFFPIVHSEGDFYAPLYLGECAEVVLSFFNVGTTSFSYVSEIFKEGEKVARVSIVHVCYSLEKKCSLPLSEIGLKFLN